MKREAKFVLDKPKSTVPTTIFLRFTCKDGVLPYSTRQKILPSEWNSDLQRAIKSRHINAELDRLYHVVEIYVESCRILSDRPILKADLKAELDMKSNRNVSSKEHNRFFTSFSEIINRAESGDLVVSKTKKNYSAGTLVNWRKIQRILYEFNPKMEFNTITLETYSSFIKFCHHKQWGANYTGALIRGWKSIMTISHGLKWHDNIIYKHPEFKGINEVPEKLYLNEEDIERLYRYDLSGNNMKEVIRDRFIINLFNGLRISDMKTLTVENIQNGMITHINKKTNKKVVIPVHPYVVEIITRYDGKMPRQYAEAVVNRNIKLIAKAAGLTDKFSYSRTIGGSVHKFNKEKWELITNHTGRRSMATNLLKAANPLEAMPVLGMSLKTLQLYNKITPEENAIALKSNRFFKK